MMFDFLMLVAVFAIGFQVGDYFASRRHARFLAQVQRVLDGDPIAEVLGDG